MADVGKILWAGMLRSVSMDEPLLIDRDDPAVMTRV
jgi:hypothetical protein